MLLFYQNATEQLSTELQSFMNLRRVIKIQKDVTLSLHLLTTCEWRDKVAAGPEMDRHWVSFDLKSDVNSSSKFCESWMERAQWLKHCLPFKRSWFQFPALLGNSQLPVTPVPLDALSDLHVCGV